MSTSVRWLSALLGLAATMAAAQSVPPALLPLNPQIEASSGGGTTFNSNAAKTRLDINSSSRRVVIRWDSFNIGAGNEVVFTLPDGQSIAVNRVACVANCAASNINGVLRSNGNVWILNPAGVLFGVSARVDVGGLLATPAGIDDIRGFVSAATDAPIAFSMPANPGPVLVSGGAQILLRGGPGVLVGRNVTVSGTVKAADDSSDAEKSSSQVLYGAANKFRVLLKESAPSAIASGDLDLFDFIIDEGFAPPSGGANSPAISINAGSLTRAGQVLVHAKAAGTAAAGCSGCIAISSTLEATAADRSGPLAAALSVRGEGVDLLLQRTARFSSSGAAALDPQVTLSSRGSMNLAARGIFAPQLLGLRSSTTSPVVALPDHVTVELTAGGPISLTADESILMTSAKLGGARLSAKGDVLLSSAIADPNAGAITAGGSILLSETSDADGRGRQPGANLTVGDLKAGGDIFVEYRKAFTAGNAAAGGVVEVSADSIRTGNVKASSGSVFLLGSDGVTTGDVDAATGVSLRAAGGALKAGAIKAGGALELAGKTSLTVSDVNATGVVATVSGGTG
ncbi:MAG: filamentous hemagglutinin N-terminal domain-containing protein, partial [Gammaproteobacteria bacterium]|nr:filamentous hemagglutinin N-terminal domain-containing protein [Gammaproteobacteria bacterium]